MSAKIIPFEQCAGIRASHKAGKRMQELVPQMGFLAALEKLVQEIERDKKQEARSDD